MRGGELVGYVFVDEVIDGKTSSLTRRASTPPVT